MRVKFNHTITSYSTNNITSSTPHSRNNFRNNKNVDTSSENVNTSYALSKSTEHFNSKMKPKVMSSGKNREEELNVSESKSANLSRQNINMSPTNKIDDKQILLEKINELKNRNKELLEEISKLHFGYLRLKK